MVTSFRWGSLPEMCIRDSICIQPDAVLHGGDDAIQGRAVLTKYLHHPQLRVRCNANYILSLIHILEITGLAKAPNWWKINQALTLACDNSGTLYTVGQAGEPADRQKGED